MSVYDFARNCQYLELREDCIIKKHKASSNAQFFTCLSEKHKLVTAPLSALPYIKKIAKFKI